MSKPLLIHKSFRPLYNPTAAFNLAKLGVPRPVTGSQPVVALKPLVLQPGFEPDACQILVGIIKNEYVSVTDQR